MSTPTARGPVGLAYGLSAPLAAVLAHLSNRVVHGESTLLCVGDDGAQATKKPLRRK